MFGATFETALGGFTAIGALIASIFLAPSQLVWGLCGLIIVIVCLGLIMQKQWMISKPNEWLLVIRNGKLIRAGVGLKTLITPYDTVVRFPSRVERVSFDANNVTKEMQGVIITGFAFWSVYRDDEGPFRCYKYMEGGDANTNVQAMCESALRNLIANSTLNEVMKNRSHLRDNMKADLKDQFRGWGIWLESVEITQVKISSNRLFTDLQAEFRQETRLKAEKIELDSSEKMQESRQSSQLRMSQMNETNNTKKLETKNYEDLKRRKQTADFEQKKNDMEIKRLDREKRFDIQKLKNELEKNQEKLSNEQKIEDAKQAFQLDFLKKKLDVDKLHDDKTLHKYQIDVMERIYTRLGIKEIKINQFVGDTKSSLASILPGIGFGSAQMRSAQ